MIPNRESSAERPNEDLHELAVAGEPTEKAPAAEPAAVAESEGNASWFERSELREGVLLLGGSSLADFRVRYAQSQLRRDLTPSFWSACGLVSQDGTFRTVPLQPADVSEVPATNGVRNLSIEDIDDPVRWPNIAVLQFARDAATVERYATTVAERRTIIDLPDLLLAWLGYVWAAGNSENPLARGQGVPGAAYVETAYSLAGIELTPGLSSAASCPEAIWQAVKWWHEYYDGVVEIGAGEAGAVRPRGYYLVRQAAAAVAWPR
ncbi:MAG: hypothetical protein M3253_01025 [Chloroflexota bacterium]|nr:hypothetical protein [Chloroflexota bacterium]